MLKTVCDLLGKCPCYQGIWYLSEIAHMWETELNSQETVQTVKILEGSAELQIIVFNHRALETQPFGAWRLSLATSSCNAKLIVEHNEDILQVRGEKKHWVSSHGREHKK